MNNLTAPLSQNKFTTLAGALTTISALLLTFVPRDVVATCGKAISESQNPAMIGILFSAGTLLSLIGPSLVGRSAK